MRRSWNIPVVLVALSVLVFVLASSNSGCALFVRHRRHSSPPANHQTQNTDSGMNTATYSIPMPTAPEGSIRIQPTGVVELKDKVANTPVSALHIQMVVSNESSAEPWMLDSRRQLLRLEGRGNFRSAVVETTPEDIPLIRVKPGETQIIDFYFPLPQEMAAEKESLPDFELDWEVITGVTVISKTTRFDHPISKVFESDVSILPFTAR